MYHLRLKGDHYEMGMKRGEIFKRCRIFFPLQLDEFQLEHGKRSEEILRNFFPEVCEEIRGVSDTIEADYLQFASWMLCMGCCMYNLESSIPAEIRGCTAFAYSKNGRLIYGRNNDLPPYLRDGCKSENLPIASNCNILLADQSGDMVVAECTPAIKNIREAESFNENRIVCTVNSFTSDKMKHYDDANGNDYDSCKRYKTVLHSFSSGQIRDDYIERMWPQSH